MTSFTDFFSLYVYLHCSIWPLSANAALPLHLCLQTTYLPSAYFLSSSFASSPTPYATGCHSTSPPFSPFPDLLRVLQWNVGGLRARSIELLNFISSHCVDLICIQESNLISSSPYLAPGRCFMTWVLITYQFY